jgi:hypothetical protein
VRKLMLMRHQLHNLLLHCLLRGTDLQGFPLDRLNFKPQSSAGARG